MLYSFLDECEFTLAQVKANPINRYLAKPPRKRGFSFMNQRMSATMLLVSRPSGCGESTHSLTNNEEVTTRSRSDGFPSLFHMSFVPQENVSLASFSNYKIGGPARYFFEAQSFEELHMALAWANEKKIILFILGGGTNLLFADAGYDGLVLKPALMDIKRDGSRVTVGAGVGVASFLEFCIAQELSGFEWAGGLPGTIGGAVRGNAGAFKGETKDSIMAAQSIVVDSLEERERDNIACRFGYRTSVFKELNGQEIILSAIFDLRAASSELIRRAIQEKIDYRIARHPIEYPNIGSIFKNVDLMQFPEERHADFVDVVKHDPFPVVPTAYLISEAGLKGMTHGGAMISPKHPNFIVNTGSATAEDVLALIALVKESVSKKFSVLLEEEVQIVSATSVA